MKKKIKKPKHNSNVKVTEMINEASDRLRGIDNAIPPIPNVQDDYLMKQALGQMNTYNPTHSEAGSSYELPPPPRTPFIFTDGFIDSALALCFCGCLTCLGLIIGVNLK